eukprot:7230117-Heterocapsa_arctica.AAC.1
MSSSLSISMYEDWQKKPLSSTRPRGKNVQASRHPTRPPPQQRTRTNPHSQVSHDQAWRSDISWNAC